MQPLQLAAARGKCRSKCRGKLENGMFAAAKFWGSKKSVDVVKKNINIMLKINTAGINYKLVIFLKVFFYCSKSLILIIKRVDDFFCLHRI